MTGAEEQVISIGQNDLGVEIIGELARSEAFNRSLSSDRHEYGRFDCAVSGVQQTRARTGMGTGGLNFKAKSGGQAFIVADGGKLAF